MLGQGWPIRRLRDDRMSQLEAQHDLSLVPGTLPARRHRADGSGLRSGLLWLQPDSAHVLSQGDQPGTEKIP